LEPLFISGMPPISFTVSVLLSSSDLRFIFSGDIKQKGGRNPGLDGITKKIHSHNFHRDLAMNKIFFFVFVTFEICVSQQFSRAIEDNSYFIEEAYNQEPGVIQHISNLYYPTKAKDLLFSYTEEWPVVSQLHQLSVTLPYYSLNMGSNGIGDILLNYRYQFWNEEHWAWIAPRFSVILPTGNKSKGMGSDAVGFQVNIPVSKRLTNEFIIHGNAGATLFPSVKETVLSGEVNKTLSSYFAGVSGIYLFQDNFNLMLEVLHSYNSSIDGAGMVTYKGETIVNPGVRWAINTGDLQIVPGVAFPIKVTSSATDLGYFGYLSFEHPL
jgi:hypothetical protein